MSRSVGRFCVIASLVGTAVFSAPFDVVVGQTFTTLSNLEPRPEASALDRPSSKVINILPISHLLTRQDVPVTQDQAAETPPPGELLPGLERSQELVIPQEAEPEALPDSREIIANPESRFAVAWVGLNQRAKPKTDTADQAGNRVGQGRVPSHSMSRVFRRPSPPPPVISPFQPAFVQIPVHIQVVPMYVEHNHYWHGIPSVPGHYFGAPSVAPALPPVPAPYGSSVAPPPSQRPDSFGIDRRVHVPTDQPMQYVREVNLVGNVSNSVNFVAYPLNYHSYPAYRAYGVQFQTFPVHRLLP